MTPTHPFRRLALVLGFAAAGLLAGHELAHAGHDHAGEAEAHDHCCLCHATVVSETLTVLPAAPAATVAAPAVLRSLLSVFRLAASTRSRAPPAA